MPALLGEGDANLHQIEAEYPGTDIHVRGNHITVSGPEVETVSRLFEEMIAMLQSGHPLDSRSVRPVNRHGRSRRTAE